MAKRKRAKKNRGYEEKVRARQREARKFGLGAEATYPLIWAEIRRRRGLKTKEEAIKQ